MLILAGIGFYSCGDITKGYLETGEAGYATDTLRIAKDHTIAMGTYRADFRVWNLGRSFVLPGIYTIVVEPAAATVASGSREEG